MTDKAGRIPRSLYSESAFRHDRTAIVCRLGEQTAKRPYEEKAAWERDAHRSGKD